MIRLQVGQLNVKSFPGYLKNIRDMLQAVITNTVPKLDFCFQVCFKSEKTST